MTKPICEVKRCLLDDREEDISQYIEDEILALITRLELKNPDAHLGCLQMMVKRHLEYHQEHHTSQNLLPWVWDLFRTILGIR